VSNTDIDIAFKEPSFRHSYAATGVDPGIISNRISHVFGLNGPSIVVNTACSSSVYALHNACNALRNQECSGAVVGGTNLVLTVYVIIRRFENQASSRVRSESELSC